MADWIKNPLAVSLNDVALKRANDLIQSLGKSLPCTVAQVVSSGIVVVNFEVNSAPATLPRVTVPVLGSEYIRYPIQVGDKGMVLSADVRLGGITGLGAGVPDMTRPGNLSALVFAWLGNTAWSATDDVSSVVIYGPGGVILRDIGSNSVLSVSPPNVVSDSPNTITTGNLVAGTGATGSFTTTSGSVVTVQNGIITNIF